MTDLEMTRLCAEAMEYEILPYQGGYIFIKRLRRGEQEYKPLHDDAQAMALDQYILAADYCISYARDECEIYPTEGQTPETHRPVFYFKVDMTKPENRRRVRVECVAKMQKARAAE